VLAHEQAAAEQPFDDPQPRRHEDDALEQRLPPLLHRPVRDGRQRDERQDGIKNYSFEQTGDALTRVVSGPL
jgi:hypothetical protein